MKRKILWATLIATLAAACSLTWLAASEAGLRWVYPYLARFLPAEVSVSAVSGRLIGPLALDDVRYRSAEIALRIDRLTLDWRPVALLGNRLHITRLRTEGVRIDLRAPARSTAPRSHLPALRLPFRLTVEDARLRNISISPAEGAAYHIDTVTLDADAGRDSLRIDSLKVQAPNFRIAARGAIALAATAAADFEMSWSAALPNYPALEGEVRLSGNIEKLHVRQRLTAPADMQVEGDISDLLAEPRWRARLTLPQLNARRINTRWPALMLSAEAHGSGSLDAFQISGNFVIGGIDGRNVSGDLALQRRADTWILDELALRVPGSDARASLHARYGTQDRTPRIDASADWRALAWPLGGIARIASPEGKLHLEGSLADYRIRLDTRLSAPNAPPVALHLAGAGSPNELTLRTMDVRLLRGALNGTAAIAWKPAVRWKFALTAADLHPETQWPEWPGNVQGQATGQGGIQPGGIVRATLAGGLQGTLRRQPLTARVQVAVDGDRYELKNLRWRVGPTAVTAAGRVAAVWDFNWRIDAKDLGVLLPGGSGMFASQGRVTGPRRAPTIVANANGKDLAYENLRASTLAGEAAIDLSDRTGSRVGTTLTGLQIDAHTLDRMELRAQGKIARHRVVATAQSAQQTFSLVADGAYRDTTFSGELRESRFQSPDTGVWALERSAPFLVSARRFRFGEWCWHTGKVARACIRGEWQKAAGGSARVLVREFPLAPLRRLLPEAAHLRGMVSGSAEGLLDHEGSIQGALHFEAGPGLIAGPANHAVFEYRGATLDAVADKKRSRVEFAMVLAGDDRVAATLSLPQLRLPIQRIIDQPIKGALTARIGNLQPIVSALFPDLGRVDGRLGTTLRIDGTVRQPRIAGSANLADGAVQLTLLGVRIHDINSNITVDRRGAILLDARAQSGEGWLKANGKMSFGTDDSWAAALTITGDRFEASNTRDAWVLVSPSLRVRARPRRVDVEGEVGLPQARLAPRSPPEVAEPSRDVVIVNAPRDAARRLHPWDIYARIRVVFGDQVSFEGFGLTGKVAGDIAVTEEPQKATTGRGELRIAEGKYQAYGQKLEIERGRLLFVGGPIDNPGIDARAVRRVGDVLAGIKVVGTLKSPELTLFSEPPMPDSQTLSYLLLGRPTEEASVSDGRLLMAAASALELTGGEFLAKSIGAQFGLEEISIEPGTTSEGAALVIGKRLSPSLYVNYSVGLFEQINLLRIKYQINKRWAVQTESGTYTGADLLYGIER